VPEVLRLADVALRRLERLGLSWTFFRELAPVKDKGGLMPDPTKLIVQIKSNGADTFKLKRQIALAVEMYGSIA